MERYVNDPIQYKEPLETKFRSIVSTKDFNKLNTLGSELLIKQAALNSKYNVKNLTEADQKLFLSILFKDETYNPEPEGVLLTKVANCYTDCSDTFTNSMANAKYNRTVNFIAATVLNFTPCLWGSGTVTYAAAIYIYDRAVAAAISQFSACNSRC